MTVAVLVVNWNSGAFLADCLSSIARQRLRPDHVVVVDNGSTDDSLVRAKPWLTDVELIRLSWNAGFARANNIAARAAARFDALALLNPDAVAEPGWLDALVHAADRHPTAASFASQMRFASAPELLDGAGDAYHVSGRAWRKGHCFGCDDWPAADGEVFAACGAAALYRRDAFNQAGGFDERYFCYFEDVDLGFRLRLRGFKCIYVHQAIVHHVSSGISGYGSDFAVYHGERNLVWTFLKNMPAPLLWLYMPQHVILNVAGLLSAPWRSQGKVVARAKIDALRGMRGALEQRAVVQASRTVDSRCIWRALERGPLRPYFRRYSTWRRRNAAPHFTARNY